MERLSNKMEEKGTLNSSADAVSTEPTNLQIVLKASSLLSPKELETALARLEKLQFRQGLLVENNAAKGPEDNSQSLSKWMESKQKLMTLEEVNREMNKTRSNILRIIQSHSQSTSDLQLDLENNGLTCPTNELGDFTVEKIDEDELGGNGGESKIVCEPSVSSAVENKTMSGEKLVGYDGEEKALRKRRSSVYLLKAPVSNQNQSLATTTKQSVKTIHLIIPAIPGLTTKKCQIIKPFGNKVMSGDEERIRSVKTEIVEAVDVLQVKLVAERIFSFLSLQDLLSCRAVCKNWKNLSLPFVKSLAVPINLHLNEEEKKKFKTKSFHVESTSSLTSFVKSGDFPFKKVRFGSSIYSASDSLMFNQFLLEVGNHLTEINVLPLKLNLTAISLDVKFPSLKSLQIKWAMENQVERVNSSSLLFKTILARSPNLEKLVLFGNGKDEPVNEFVDIICSISCVNLTHLELSRIELYDDLFERLAALKLKLKGLVLNLYYNFLLDQIEERKSDGFCNFLGSLTNLEYLELSAPEIVDLPELPTFKKLKSLKLCWTVRIYPFTGFWEKFPVLKEFSFDQITNGYYCGLFPNCEPLKTVTTLNIGDLEENQYILMNFERCARLFPNLKVLKVSPDTAKSFALVCYHWPGLEELVVEENLNGCLEEILLGVEDHKSETAEEENFEKQLKSGGGHLTNLKDLMILRMRFIYCDKKAQDEITDLSCKLFLQMKLRCVDFGNTPSRLNISSGMLEEMKRKFTVLGVN